MGGAVAPARAATAACGAPHWWQKVVPALRFAPQAAQLASPRVDPQLEQNFPLAGWLHLGQGIEVVFIVIVRFRVVTSRIVICGIQYCRSEVVHN